MENKSLLEKNGIKINGMCFSDIKITGIDDVGALYECHCFNDNNGCLVIQGDFLIDYAVSDESRSRFISFCTFETNFTSIEDCKKTLEKVQTRLRVKYGIHIDITSAVMNLSTIRKRLYTDDDIKKYDRPLSILMSRIHRPSPDPLIFRVESKYWDCYSGAVFHTSNPKSLVKNEIVISYGFTSKKESENFFGTCKVFDLTDEAIIDSFRKRLNEDLLNPMADWKAQMDKDLIYFMNDRIRDDAIRWQEDALLFLANYEIRHRCPWILGIDELISLVDKLEIPRSQRYSVKNNFLSLVQDRNFNNFLCDGDDRRMAEILDKLSGVVSSEARQ